MTALTAARRPEVTSSEAPPATRFRRPGWRDPRLVVGVLLVCLSVVLGAQLLSGRDDVAQVWAAADAVSAGETLTREDLRPVGVRFADEADAASYVSADDPLPEGTVATRDLSSGELLPAAVLGGQGEGLMELPLAVPGGGVPTGLVPGHRVDVWVVPRAQAAARVAQGRQVLEDVPVLRIGGGRGLEGPETPRQVLVGVDAELRLGPVVGQLADNHVVLVRRA
jgi:hypothetical protein